MIDLIMLAGDLLVRDTSRARQHKYVGADADDAEFLALCCLAEGIVMCCMVDVDRVAVRYLKRRVSCACALEDTHLHVPEFPGPKVAEGSLPSQRYRHRLENTNNAISADDVDPRFVIPARDLTP
jgi:hypothetical protein